MALYAIQIGSIFSGGATTTTSLNAATIERDRPSVHAGSLRLTLVGFSGGSFQTRFDIHAEKDGFLPTFFTPYLLIAEPCPGFGARRNSTYSVDDVKGDGFRMFWTGGSADVSVYYDVPSSAICDLTYFGYGRQMRFHFR